jgi:hypothetical protein
MIDFRRRLWLIKFLFSVCSPNDTVIGLLCCFAKEMANFFVRRLRLTFLRGDYYHC